MSEQSNAPVRLRNGVDRTERRPVHVVWEITLSCNLRCAHCGSRAGRPRQNELTTDECLRVVDQLAALGTREINLIGGEAYLRRDWLEIVRAISTAGMKCGLQTGARALTREKIAAAVQAGLSAAGVSIDGPRDIHDRLRGVPGSFDQCLSALRDLASAGIAPGVNTQINALSAPRLEDVYQTIRDAGGRFWQVQLTVPTGNAADAPDIILQPYQLPEIYDRLARLFEIARHDGIRIFPGNNIGYFGPYEHLWRTLTDQPDHWGGCEASETTLGLESDGTVKGCPSLHLATYGGGNVRNAPLAEIWRAMGGTVSSAVRDEPWGFCGGCYYSTVCRAGCTWTAAAVAGKPGNNPFCDYRARTLRSEGLRERIECTAAAPGEPFDSASWRIVLEEAPADLQQLPHRPRPSASYAPVGSLVPCLRCREFNFEDEDLCVFCGGPLPEAQPRGRPEESAMDGVSRILENIAELDRTWQAEVAKLTSARRAGSAG